MSAVRCHDEHTHTDPSAELTAVATGLVACEGAFAGGVELGCRFVRRDHKNVVSRHRYAIGSHDVAHEVTDVLVATVRRWWRDLLVDRADIWTGCEAAWFRYVGTGTTSRAAGAGGDVGVVVGTPGRGGASLRYGVFVHG